MSKKLKKMSEFDAVIIDDLGYVQQSREDMAVLFTFLADRYEQGSLMIYKKKKIHSYLKK